MHSPHTPTALDTMVSETGGTQALLSELVRVKAMFQARSIAAVMGIPGPTTLAPNEAQRSEIYAALIGGHAEPDRREMAERSLGFASPILNEESNRG